MFRSKGNRAKVGVVDCLLLGFVACAMFSMASGLPTSIREEVLAQKYLYTSVMERSEFEPGELAVLSNRAQKAGYNVSGKPLLVEIVSPGGQSKVLAEGLTDTKGGFVVPFEVGDSEGKYHLLVYFLNSRHLYTEHINFLSFEVVSKSRFVALLVVLLFGVLGFLALAVIPNRAADPWTVNPFLVFLKPLSFGARSVAEQAQFLLGSGATFLAVAQLVYGKSLFVFVGLFGVVFCLRQQSKSTANALFYGQVMASWVLASAFFLFLVEYGQSELLVEFFSKKIVVGVIMGLLFLCPAPLFWIPFGVLVAGLTPLYHALALGLVSCVLFGTYAFIEGFCRREAL